jgi:hypothetical protein
LVASFNYSYSTPAKLGKFNEEGSILGSISIPAKFSIPLTGVGSIKKKNF